MSTNPFAPSVPIEEMTAAWEDHLAAYLEHYAPVGRAEIDLVHAIAQARFSILNIHDIENKYFRDTPEAAVSPAAVWTAYHKAILKLSECEEKIYRSLDRNLQALALLRSARSEC